MDNIETELIRVDNVRDFSVNSTCIVSNKVYYYFIFSVSEIKQKGLYCFDINTGIDSLIYNEYVHDIITDYSEYVYIFDSLGKALQFSIHNSDYVELFIAPQLNGFPALVLDSSGEILCARDPFSSAVMYFLKTGEYINLSRRLSHVSFNQDSTRMICTLERFYPNDFKREKQ